MLFAAIAEESVDQLCSMVTVSLVRTVGQVFSPMLLRSEVLIDRETFAEWLLVTTGNQ